jgi:DHA1 family tetracycline resistance protein-like MFS transporter
VAPFMGALADRFGRRPLILASLAAYMAAFTGYLLVPSAPGLIIMRGLAGAFTAGLVPAVTGLASDIAPQERRAQWMGYVIGGASFGWVAGPLAGGLIYDQWGYSSALAVSIAIAGLTFLVALLALPKSRPAGYPAAASARPDARLRPVSIRQAVSDLRSTLPRDLARFVAVLFICFAVMFAWAFNEPEFMFYLYNDLDWSSSMLGLAMSAFGAAMMLGEFGLGRLSDRWGRKPVILIGLLLYSAQYLGLAFLRDYSLIALSFAIGGFGNSLFDPALTASILDISPPEHRARSLGLKQTAGLSGNILGPALVVLVSTSLTARNIFLISTCLVALALAAGLSLRKAAHPASLPPEPVGA